MGDPMKTDNGTGKSTVKRREFLRLAGLGGVAAGAATVAGSPRETAAETANGQARSDGYRATAHVRKYYDLSRF